MNFMRAGRRISAPAKRAMSAAIAKWVISRVRPTPQLPGEELRVSYAHMGFPKDPPGPSVPVSGGAVKYVYLHKYMPHSGLGFNILYAVSSSHWRFLAETDLVRLARDRGARVIWNQNGVGYRGWHSDDWERINKPMERMLKEADYIFYQSRFCKLSADRFVGEPEARWEILYNAVDTRAFTPQPSVDKQGPLLLLLAGTQYQYYRLECAIRTLAALTCQGINVKLRVTGRLRWISDESKAARMAWDLANKLDVAAHVVFTGPYTQKQAPGIMQRAHILLHPKYNDPCPSVVLEAMACGVPVVYSHSGGVPELVGDEAGMGVPAPLNWERDEPPDPGALAEAVLKVAQALPQYSAAARQRAVEEFDLRAWIRRHREVFEELLGG